MEGFGHLCMLAGIFCLNCLTRSPLLCRAGWIKTCSAIIAKLTQSIYRTYLNREFPRKKRELLKVVLWNGVNRCGLRGTYKMFFKWLYHYNLFYNIFIVRARNGTLLQAVAFGLAGVTALVATASGVKLPWDIDGDVSDIAIHVYLLTIIHAIIGCRSCSVCTEDVFCCDRDIETFVL